MEPRGAIAVADSRRWIGAYWIEPETGSVIKRVLNRTHDTTFWGWADRCAGRTTVIFKRPRDTHLILRVGGRVLDLSAPLDPVTLTFARKRLVSQLRVSSCQGTLSASNFTPGRLFWPLIDPTWDAIDEESGDFLITVARTVQQAIDGELARETWPFQRTP